MAVASANILKKYWLFVNVNFNVFNASALKETVGIAIKISKIHSLNIMNPARTVITYNFSFDGYPPIMVSIKINILVK